MSDHTRAIVPLEAWAYSSPALCQKGISVDVGLLCESLLYYDRILFNVANQPQFAELVQWFDQRGEFGDTFEGLLADGVLGVYEYGFMTATVRRGDKYIALNIQDEVQSQPNTFMQRFLEHESVVNALNPNNIGA